MTTATEPRSVPKAWVTLAALMLAVAALAGIYLGAERSINAHDLPSDADPLSASAPNVATAKPLADTSADDARIRSLVREEVAAALKSAKPAASKPTPKADDDSTTASEATAALNAAASGKPAASSDGASTKPAAAKPPRSTTTTASPSAATPN